jgi:hypothetical protein
MPDGCSLTTVVFYGDFMSRFSGLFSVRRSKRVAAVTLLVLSLSVGGATSAKALDLSFIQRFLDDVRVFSDGLSQGLQTFSGIANVPVGNLGLPTTQETQQAIANLFGAGNQQANANNLVNSITSMTATDIANKKIWSKEGQKQQKEIADELVDLDKDSLANAKESRLAFDSANTQDSSQEILRSMSQQLKNQAFISDDQSRLLVIQNSLLQESNLQTSAANGSTASTQAMISGQAKRKDIEDQQQMISNYSRIQRYIE